MHFSVLESQTEGLYCRRHKRRVKCSADRKPSRPTYFEVSLVLLEELEGLSVAPDDLGPAV